MRIPLILVLLAVGALIVLLIGSLRGDGGAGSEAAPAAAAPPAPAPEVQADLADPGPAAEDGGAEAAGPASPPAEAAPVDEPTPETSRPEPPRGPRQDEDPRQVEVRGRAIFPEGLPVDGGRARLNAVDRDLRDLGAILAGPPSGGRAPARARGGVAANIQGDGLFEMWYVPEGGAVGHLLVLEGRRGAEAWYWPEIEPGSTLDLGDLPLRWKGTIEGEVVDRDGERVEGWSSLRILAQSLAATGIGEVGVLRSTGVGYWGGFDLHLPAGPARLLLLDRADRLAGQAHVEVRAGATIRAEVVYRGSEVQQQVWVATSSTLGPPALLRPDSIRVHGSGTIGVRPDPDPEGHERSSLFIFSGLSGGPYRVEIDEPGYEPWSVDGVSPGGPIVHARLRGSSAIELWVGDALTGLPVEPFSARAVSSTAGGASASPSTDPEGSEDGPAIIDELTPGDWELSVSAPGYVRARQTVPQLLSNEVRRVGVSLSKGSTAAGTVVDHTGRRPVAGVTVELKPWGHSGSGRTCRTDDFGRFAFERIPTGSHALSAGFGPDSRASLRIDVAGERHIVGLRLMLPRTQCAVGRVLAPEGAPLEGLVVEASAAPPGAGLASLGYSEAERAELMREFEEHDLEDLDPEWRRQAQEFRSLMLRAEGPEDGSKRIRLEGAVGAGGRYQIGPLPPGQAMLTLRLPSPLPDLEGDPRGGGRGLFVPGILQSVDISVGQNSRADIELGDRAPGLLLARVRGQEPVVGVVVECLDPMGELVMAALTDSGGRARIPMIAGEWRVAVRSVDCGWRVDLPDPVRVASAKTVEVPIALELATATLRVLDEATGEPLSGTELVWWDPRSGHRISARTGAAGQLTLTLPPGSYSFERVAEIPPTEAEDGETEAVQERGRAASVSWTAAGPQRESLRLPAR